MVYLQETVHASAFSLRPMLVLVPCISLLYSLLVYCCKCLMQYSYLSDADMPGRCGRKMMLAVNEADSLWAPGLDLLTILCLMVWLQKNTID